MPQQYVSTPNDTQAPAVREDGWGLADVMQGKIGDCYYISALGMLALYESRFKNKPVLTDMVRDMVACGVDIDKPCKAGAYMFRFYRANEPIYVIVDDLLPIDTEGKVIVRVPV
jgi:hypothetical protein